MAQRKKAPGSCVATKKRPRRKDGVRRYENVVFEFPNDDMTGTDALSISASWCDFGEVFAGVWIEEGNELLFLFRLPR